MYPRPMGAKVPFVYGRSCDAAETRKASLARLARHLVELTKPDIPDGYFARLTFDFKADQPGLVID